MFLFPYSKNLLISLLKFMIILLIISYRVTDYDIQLHNDLLKIIS